MKILKKIIGIISLAISGFLVASFVLIYFFKFVPAEVASNSMQPTFAAGEIVLIKKQQNYVEGDIVMFKQNGINITHRLIAVVKDGANLFYVCKGDAHKLNGKTSWQDCALELKNKDLGEIKKIENLQIVEKENIIGKAVENHKNFAKFLKFVVKFKNFLIFLLIFCIFVIIISPNSTNKIKQTQH